MHTGHTHVGHNFLSEVFPRMHMVLYNAVTSVKGFEDKATTFIDDLQNKGESMVSEKVWQGEERFMAVRGLGILAKLYEKGYTKMLSQYKRQISDQPLGSEIEGIVLQVIPNYRWEKKYETTAVDVVLAVPKWEKVIAFSASDTISEEQPSPITKYSRIHLDGFYFYPLFNRAHGVRGRKVVNLASDSSKTIDPVTAFSFLIRTCNDSLMIGKSYSLPSFTPVETKRGLQLGFYFGLLAKVIHVQPVRSATGFGSNFDVTKLTLSDGVGEITCNLNTRLFLENLSLPCNASHAESIRDPLRLAEYSGWTFFLCAWLFGQSEPFVVTMQFLANETDVSNLLFAAYMRTRRKVHKTDMGEWKQESSLNTALGSNKILTIDEWLYYKHVEWAAGIFAASIKKEFEPLKVSDISKTGVSYNDCKDWEQSFHSFMRANPMVKELYLSRNPKSTLQDLFPHDLGKKDTTDPLSGVYKCTRCNLAMIESQLEDGNVKRCIKCGSVVEPFLKADGSNGSRHTTMHRFKASKFLGSDPWLKSLFD